MTSESIENYLKAIYKLEDGEQWVTTGDLARRLGYSPPSVSRMVKKLSERDWVLHSPYQGVRLTDAGRRHALRIIRNHRILETYFAEVLGMPWERVDDEVERLEHVVSDELIDRMEKALGFPERDPHGSPIPDRDGRMPSDDELQPLVELDTAGITVRIQRIADAHPEALSYLDGLGVRPGVSIRYVGAEPFGGPLRIEVAGQAVHLGHELALKILVVPE